MQINKSILKTVKNFKKQVQDKYSVDKFIVFGSAVNGNFNESSDIDICIVSDDYDGLLEEMDMGVKQIRRNVDLRIEPHNYHTRDFTPDNLFVKEILKNGIEI
jgi:predicted nucleotidyltransferase